MSAWVLNLPWLEFHHLEPQMKAAVFRDAQQCLRSHPFSNCATFGCDDEHCLILPCPNLPMCKICMTKWSCLEINWYWYSPENLERKGLQEFVIGSLSEMPAEILKAGSNFSSYEEKSRREGREMKTPEENESGEKAMKQPARHQEQRQNKGMNY